MAKKEGRPSKYKSEYCDELVKFFDREPYYEKELQHFDKDGSYKWSDYKRYPNDLPTFAHFAKKIGVNGDTLVEWTKVNKEFSAAYKRAKELQKEFLIENGLQGLYNATFAIFTAKNITDMRDVQAIQYSGEDGGPIQIRIVKDANNNNNE